MVEYGPAGHARLKARQRRRREDEIQQDPRCLEQPEDDPAEHGFYESEIRFADESESDAVRPLDQLFR